GSGIPEGQYDLHDYSAVRLGDTTYYRDADGAYHRLNSRRELVEDFDVESVRPENISGHERVSPALEQPVGTGGHSIEAGTRIEINGRNWEVVGEQDGEVLLVRQSHRRELGEPRPVSEADLASSYRRVGDSGYYRDAHGESYQLHHGSDGRMELVP